MELGIEGRACVVTGASSGIGLATARLLSAEGGRLLLVARDGDALAEGAPPGAATLAADVTEAGAAEEILEECERVHGALDILVNNAGTSRARDLDELTDDEWDEQW